jgi:hypothetical protein
MAYSDFDLATARERFGLTLVEDRDLFAAVPEVAPGRRCGRRSPSGRRPPWR